MARLYLRLCHDALGGQTRTRSLEQDHPFSLGGLLGGGGGGVLRGSEVWAEQGLTAGVELTERGDIVAVPFDA